MLTIYYGCRRDFSGYVSTYIGDLDCDNGDTNNYYVMRNLFTLLLQGTSSFLIDFSLFCNRNVNIPASGQALKTLQRNSTTDNLREAFKKGFELQVNQDCQICIKSTGACGYSQISNGFICYYMEEETHHRTKGLASAAATLLMFPVLTIFLLKRKASHDLSQHRLKALIPQPKLEALIPLKQYSYAQVKRITKSFAEVVGRGGFGIVYRGILCDGCVVAVKVLKDSKGNNSEDFINEVASMSQTSHVNIVTLLGFCSEGSKRAIIYEFLENGSLDKFISSNTSENTDWMALYRIALGVARGLEYLHHGCRTRIVHFDIKPQNVLLDDNLSPKVSTFGLAKLCERKESILSLLDTRGTIGYIAPEVFSRVYGSASHKSDVYSYGMLVLEMIGARNKSSTEETAASTSSIYFPEWIYKDLEKGDNGKLIENGISSTDEEIAKKMTLVGLWCIQTWPSNRPPMNRVVEMMEGNVNALEVPPRPVLQIPATHLLESSMISDDSGYTEARTMNVA